MKLIFKLGKNNFSNSTAFVSIKFSFGRCSHNPNPKKLKNWTDRK